MVADTSIYSMLRPMSPPVDPLQSYGQLVSLKGMMDQQGLAELQRRKLETDFAEEDAFKSAFRNAPDGKVNIQELFRASPTRAIQYQKSDLETKKLTGDITKNEAETKLKNWELLDKVHTANLQELGGANDQNSWDAMRTNIFERMAQITGPDKARQSLANIPAEYSPENQQRLMSTGLKTAEQLARLKPDYKEVKIDNGGVITTQFIDTNPITNPGIGQMNIVTQKVATPDAVMADTRARSEGAANRAVTMRGQNLAADRGQYDPERGVLVNPRTGQASPVMQGGQPIQGSPKLTETQGKASGMLVRALRANEILNTMEDAGENNRGLIKQAAERVPFVGGALAMGVNTLPGIAGGPSSSQQQIEQARRDFVNAALRVESGAAISQSEFENAERQYFPMPGDSPEVIAQKRQSRQNELEALRLQAGNGASRAQPLPAQPKQKSPIDPKNLSDAELMRELGIGR